MTCYIKRNGGIVQTLGTSPCGPVPDTGAVSCCWQGHTCLSRSFCHADPRPGTSQYYLGGCTDPTFTDPSCRPECGNEGATDVAYNFYNTNSQSWTCCGSDKDGLIYCNNPKGGNFTEVAPENLFAYARILHEPDPITASALPSASVLAASLSAVSAVGTYVPRVGGGSLGEASSYGGSGSVVPTAAGTRVEVGAGVSASASASASASVGQSQASASAAPASSALGRGAVVGIVIGIIVLLAMIVAGLFFAHRLGQRKAREQVQQEKGVSWDQQSTGQQEKASDWYQQPMTQHSLVSELSSKDRPHEMDTEWYPELAGDEKPVLPPKHGRETGLALDHYEGTFAGR